MLNSFVCGTSNLPEEEHDIEELLAPCSNSTPKKHKKIKDSKNPYANRGLEKFSALLDELESKKQKIYTQKGSQYISFVRFVYSSSNDWKPIVVKAKERKQELNQGKKNIISRANSEEKDKHLAPVENSVQEIKRDILNQRNEKGSGRSRLNFKMEKLMIVLILLFLIIYGRTFAILCLSIGWYLVKMIKDSHQSSSSTLISSSGLDKPNDKKSRQNSNSTPILSSGLDKPKSEKNYGGKLSEKYIVTKESTSPRSVLGGLEEESLSARHAHQKSW